MRKEIPEHLSWKCKYRESSCEFCMSKLPLTELQVSAPSGPAWWRCCFSLSSVTSWCLRTDGGAFLCPLGGAAAPLVPLVNGVCFQKHKETVCPAFPVSCPNHCSFTSLPRSEVLLRPSIHPSVCSSSSSSCSGLFSCFCFLLQLSNHQHECPKAQVSCPFHGYGCTFQVAAPLLLSSHPLLASSHPLLPSCVCGPVCDAAVASRLLSRV